MNWDTTLKSFKSYLLLERTLSNNSVEAYLRDVEKLIAYFNIQEISVSPGEVTTAQLEDFIFWINKLGLEANSQARLISGIKAFYKYLLIEDIIADDPTSLLEGPRLRRKIPEVLNYHEIQAMMATIDLSHPHGVRNRAMLETLYACGLRVSELINLKLSNIYFDLGLIKVIGKGDKERLVPIGQEAQKHINFYRQGVRKLQNNICLLYTSPSPRDQRGSRMPSSA